jgi:hypothetical protein
VYRIAIVVVCGPATPAVASACRHPQRDDGILTQKGKTAFVESLKLGRKNIGVDRIVCKQVSRAVWLPRAHTFSNGTSPLPGASGMGPATTRSA